MHQDKPTFHIGFVVAMEEEIEGLLEQDARLVDWVNSFNETARQSGQEYTYKPVDVLDPSKFTTQMRGHTRFLTFRLETMVKDRKVELRCVACLSGIGKVHAAAATTALLNNFDVCTIVNFGYCGAIKPKLRAEVLTEVLAQQRKKAKELPVAKREQLVDILKVLEDESRNVFNHLPASKGSIYIIDNFWYGDVDLTGFGRPMGQVSVVGGRFPQQDISYDLPKVFNKKIYDEYQPAYVNLARGRCITTDAFICSDEKVREIVKNSIEVSILETVEQGKPYAVPLCFDMEGAAIAQVAGSWGVPVISLKAVSDSADEEATSSFSASAYDEKAPDPMGTCVKLVIDCLPSIYEAIQVMLKNRAPKQ